MTRHHFPNPTPARWTDLTPDGKDAAVRALAATGLTSTAMAAMLGTTKNAVLSVANRRKIAIGSDIPVTTYSARLAARAFQPGRDVAPETWAPLGPPVAEPTRKECCWPVGEAGGAQQMFCGGARHKGSYCEVHAKIAFQPDSTNRAAAENAIINSLRNETHPGAGPAAARETARVAFGRREVVGADDE